VQGALRAGILAAACESVRIAGNEVLQIGPPGQFVGSAAAIQIVRPFREATVTANTLRREVAPDGVRSEWAAIVAGGPLDRGVNRIAADTFTLRLPDDRLLLATRTAAAALALGTEDTAIEGNVVEASGSAPGIGAIVRGEVAITDNRCLQGQNAPGIAVTGEIGIVSANRVRGGEPSMVLQIDARRSTILGNITSTDIQVVPGGLQPPWNALNVIA
jgi:hypothetical protein